MPYPSYPDEYRQKFYEDGHYKSIYFVESMNNVEIVPGGDLKVNPVEDPLRPGNKTIVFTEEQLIREKFTFKEYLNSANNICVGSCECNSIEFTIRNNGVIPPLFYNTGTEQVERTFKVYVYFDHDSSTLIPLGMFRVVEDSLSGDKKERNIIMCDYMNTLRDLDAYDWYQNFKKAHPNGSTLKVFRDSFWDFMQNPDPKKGIKFPVTQKTQTLINDNVTIAYTLDEDTILLSAGNIIEDLCEINGVWGRFSRDVDSQNRSIFEYVEIPHITSKTKITKWRSIEPFQRDMYITHDWYQTKPIHAVTIRNAYDANIAQYASAELETRDNEGNVTGRFGNYAIYDNKFIDEIKSSADNTNNDTAPEDDPITPVTGFDFLKRVCKNVLSKIKYVKYTPYELTTVGDLARTCGDIIYVNGTGEDDVIEELQDYTHFFSYVFERELKGIQNMRDTYRAKGDRVLPMFGDSSSSSGYTSSGGGGAYVVQSSGITGGTGIAENVNTTGKADGVPLEYWPELIRNVGLRVPDSPKGKVVFDKATGSATITWTDPADYDDNKPIPSVWEKTYLLRSYKGRPWNIYDPSIEVLVTETVKNTYKTNGFVDSTAGQHDKIFYAIFPQNTAGYVNPFTVLSIKPDRMMEAPVITDVKNPTAHSITVDHTIPDQTSTYSKKVVVANPDHEPLDATDGIATVITNFASTVVSGLEQNRDYYFKVFLVKASGAESESDYDEGKTIEDPYWHIVDFKPGPGSEWVETVNDVETDRTNMRTYTTSEGDQVFSAMENTSSTNPAHMVFDAERYYAKQDITSGTFDIYAEFDFKIAEGSYMPTESFISIGYYNMRIHPNPVSDGLFISGLNWRGTDTYSLYWHDADRPMNAYSDGNWHTWKMKMPVDMSEGSCCLKVYVYIDDTQVGFVYDNVYLFPPFGKWYIPNPDNPEYLNAYMGVYCNEPDVLFRSFNIYTTAESPYIDMHIPKLWNYDQQMTYEETVMAYTLENGDYSAAKIVLKVGSDPTSINDGYGIDVEPTSGDVREIRVQNLEVETEYHAILFVTDQNGKFKASWGGKATVFTTLPDPVTATSYSFGGTIDDWRQEKNGTGLHTTVFDSADPYCTFMYNSDGYMAVNDVNYYNGTIPPRFYLTYAAAYPAPTEIYSPEKMTTNMHIKFVARIKPNAVIKEEGAGIHILIDVDYASQAIFTVTVDPNPGGAVTGGPCLSIRECSSTALKDTSYQKYYKPTTYNRWIRNDGVDHTVEFVIPVVSGWCRGTATAYVDGNPIETFAIHSDRYMYCPNPGGRFNLGDRTGWHYPTEISAKAGYELKTIDVWFGE